MRQLQAKTRQGLLAVVTLRSSVHEKSLSKGVWRGQTPDRLVLQTQTSDAFVIDLPNLSSEQLQISVSTASS